MAGWGGSHHEVRLHDSTAYRTAPAVVAQRSKHSMDKSPINQTVNEIILCGDMVEGVRDIFDREPVCLLEVVRNLVDGRRACGVDDR